MRFGRRWLAFLVVVAVIVAVVWLNGHIILTPGELARYRDEAHAWAEANPVAAPAIYFAAYVAVAVLALPGAAAMTMLGGSLFGLAAGTVLASAASVMGATLAMLAARYLLRGFFERRFAETMGRIDQGVARDGALYLFSLRLLPVVPFAMINLAMGLTRMRAWTFAWVSQIGMLPVTLVFVNAGSQLASIQEARDLLSAQLLGSLVTLAALPFVGKWLQRRWSRAASVSSWPRPRRFDYNLVVIGAGSAGLVTAYLAAAAKARVALVERRRMGGDCLNTGCVPSKALIRSARLAHEARLAARLGLHGGLEVDFPAVMRRIHRVIARIAPHDSAERYKRLGVEVVEGEAYVLDPWTVAVGDRRLVTRRIVVASGAEPVIPPVPGLAEARPLTSETLWSITELPGALLVVGGGAVGCELAQAFARLGSRVTLVEAVGQLLPREDPEIAAAMAELLGADGVELHTGTTIERFEPNRAHLTSGRTIAFDRLLVATGRRPRVAGFGLEELGLLEDGRLVVDERLQTRLPSIHAAGDVIGRLQLTHAAGHYAWYAAMNALFGGLRSWNVDVGVVPSVVYTDPEVARVGLSETEVRERGIAYEVTRFELSGLDRAIADEAAEGFLKVLTVPGKDRILGAAVVGSRAGDLLGEITLAMRHGLGLRAILRTVHPYPGWMEANKAVAGAWQRAHMPAWALVLSERWLRWQRGRP